MSTREIAYDAVNTTEWAVEGRLANVKRGIERKAEREEPAQTDKGCWHWRQSSNATHVNDRGHLGDSENDDCRKHSKRRISSQTGI